MDFGDVLDQWERRKPEKRVKSEPADKTRVNPMDAWMRINGVFDKDALAPHENAGERRRRLRHKKPDAALDIHNHTRDEAWEAMEHFFTDACGRKLEKVLVIHGKGNHSQGEAVLKRLVMEFIERCSFAGESGQGTEGGSGATWVILKRTAEIPANVHDK
jgi:DNA-nicking Smr family endonuclease